MSSGFAIFFAVFLSIFICKWRLHPTHNHPAKGRELTFMCIFHIITSYTIGSLWVSYEANRVIFIIQMRKLRFTEVDYLIRVIPNEAKILIKIFIACSFPKRDLRINSYNLGKKDYYQINLGDSRINKVTKVHPYRVLKH